MRALRSSGFALRARERVAQHVGRGVRRRSALRRRRRLAARERHLAARVVRRALRRVARLAHRCALSRRDGQLRAQPRGAAVGAERRRRRRRSAVLDRLAKQRRAALPRACHSRLERRDKRGDALRVK